MRSEKSAGTTNTKQPMPAPPAKSQVEFIKGSTDVLVIAPHGVKFKPMDDFGTDIVAREIASQLNCSALINDSVPITNRNYNVKTEAEQDPQFIANLKSILDADGFSLVLWIHGFEIDDIVDDLKEGGLDCIIGYGQSKPDRENRLTAEPFFIESLIKALSNEKIIAKVSPTKNIKKPNKKKKGKKPNFCGWDQSNMNQWCRHQKKYDDKTKVQSIQLEFKAPGLRDSGENARQLGIRIARAIRAVGNVDDHIVQEALEYIAQSFRDHFHNAMVDVGRYIINNFYDKDPLAAFVKNKAKDQPPNLKTLIKKLKESSGNPEGEAPSLSWFYNAVNLASHEMICERMGFQTFGKLGHSHKLQLLHYPKLKAVNGGDLEAIIKPTFEEKEQLAIHAIKKELSVRDFKRYIAGLNPDDKIDLLDLTIADLRKIDSGNLVDLYNTAQRKIQSNQAQIHQYGKVTQKLHYILSQRDASPDPGKSGFQDWTKSVNNVNICTGCENDCIYCYAKSMASRWKQVEPGQWPNMVVRDADIEKSQNLKDGMVGFPSSHDITPTNLDAYLTVLGKLLRAGNEVLIVSKPRLDCIKAICDASSFFKDKILFRFTIGAMDNGILKFWERKAPKYGERKQCLEYAFNNGFRTSVSMEPMLDSANIEALINDLRPYVNDDIWIGTMNHLESMKKGADKTLLTEIAKVEAGQSKEILTAIYDTYKDDELIKYKTDFLKIIRN